MFHVAGLYLVSAWLFVQFVDVLSQGPLPMPPEALRLIWIALILIFPVVLIFGWRYDITREGLVHTDPRAKGGLNQPLKPADHGIIAALSLVVAGIVGLTAVEIMEAIEHDRLRAGIGVEEAVAPPPANSIAVLPFTTCSGQEEDAILAAGLASEVIDRLASLKKFKVIARASSFTMAGFDLPFVKIAKPLGVKYLLTGVLCRDGETLVLRVELVDDSGYVAWTDNFEQREDASGQLTLTLATQVTEGVASALGQSFASKAENPVNPRAYKQLLIGREFAAREKFDEARAAFDKALEYDSEYSEAIWEQALLIFQQSLDSGDLGYGSFREARPIAVRAMEMAQQRVAEGHADFNTYGTLAWIKYEMGKWDEQLAWNRAGDLTEQQLAAQLEAAKALFAEAESHSRTAIALNPDDVMQYGLLGYIVERQGIDRRTEALEIFEKAVEADPFNPYMNRQVAKRWAARGSYRKAMELLEGFEALPTAPPEVRFMQLEISKLQVYWDEKCELLIDLLLHEPAAFEHTGVYGHLVWFPAELAHLGLYDEAEAWYQRVEKIPAKGWAAVLRGWFVGEYLSTVGREQDDSEEALAEIAGKSDEEILDGGGGLDAAFRLAEAGQYERAIRLAESAQHLRLDSTFWAERQIGPRIGLANIYLAAGHKEDAAALLDEIVGDLEAQYDAGIRHPDTLGYLAAVYAMQERDDKALDMLRKAVDYHLRWIEIPDWPPTSPWERLRDDPRFVAQWDRMQADLEQQAERIRGMLAQYDIDQLLAPAVDVMKKHAAETGEQQSGS